MTKPPELTRETRDKISIEIDNLRLELQRLDNPHIFPMDTELAHKEKEAKIDKLIQLRNIELSEKTKSEEQGKKYLAELKALIRAIAGLDAAKKTLENSNIATRYVKPGDLDEKLKDLPIQDILPLIKKLKENVDKFYIDISQLVDREMRFKVVEDAGEFDLITRAIKSMAKLNDNPSSKETLDELIKVQNDIPPESDRWFKVGTGLTIAIVVAMAIVGIVLLTNPLTAVVGMALLFSAFMLGFHSAPILGHIGIKIYEEGDLHKSIAPMIANTEKLLEKTKELDQKPAASNSRMFASKTGTDDKKQEEEKEKQSEVTIPQLSGSRNNQEL